MHDCEGGESQQYYEEDNGGDGKNDDAYPVVDEDGRQERSTDVEVDNTTGERLEASVQKRKRQSSTIPTEAADKRAAKKLTVVASRQALRASQEAVTESVKKQKGSTLTRATKTEKRPPKRKQMFDEGDSGEDAEEVPPRVVLMNSSLENDYCKDWTNKMRGYMNLAQCSETVWPLVHKFFDMYEKGLLLRVDGVRYIDLPGKVDGRLPGQYFLKDNSGKKVMFHCIKPREGPPGATVSIPNLTPSIFKLFGDMTAREKQVALHHMMRDDVIVTSRTVPRGRCNMADLVKYTRRERYMVRMFNYILFKAERRSKEEWSADFVIGYTTILERYNKNSLTDEKWTKERDRIPDDKARKVPRHLGSPDEINGENGAGLEATQGMYKETPFHLKCFIYEAIDCLNDLRAEVLTGSWYKHYTPSTTLNKYDNIAVRYTDMMVIVLHSENDNLDNITVAPKLQAELTNLNVEEGEFVRCSGECIGVEGDTDAVYSWMEQESARLRKLCSSFIREDDGVMLLGRTHAGLVWELARAGHHVFACDDTTKELTYLSKFLEFYVKDPRNKCRFEKPKVEHRNHRDIYYKLDRKRGKVWVYLFDDAPQSAVDNDYVIRKSELEIAMNEYHGSRACVQQSTQRSTMGDSAMIRKDGDDMESRTITEQPTCGVNDGATIVGSFGSLVATMAARQGVSEMMETDAGQDGESQTVKAVQEEVAATTEETKKGEGSREHNFIIDIISESTGEDMIQDNNQKDDHAAQRVGGDDEEDAQQPRRSTRAVIKKTVFDA
ncbi:hypothetical protein CBR_g54297 [Chara braunii]|uniref:Uncharacterized protein n=1 Tax=Chara braunii TaxID=69332 RepID=A0A388MC10_CHABU|nr:hypothetical protein CBR_g54297 [Chara braunii]|eukprot:GBG92043.1 hypothetical protein CBR_g54297 [Chara braunii]